MTSSSITQVRTIVDRLKQYKPQKVVLFGSYAWGTPTKSSDMDFLVIKPSRKLKHQRIMEVERLLYPAPLPLDVLVYTPQEIKKRLKLGDLFLRRILRDGKVVYEKK